MVRRPLRSTARVARGLEQIGGAVSRVARDLDAERGSGRLAIAWATAAGARLAHHSRPLSLHEGRLRIAVPDPTWASNLRPFAPALQTRLNEILGDDRVRELEFVIRPSALTGAGPAPRPQAPRPKAPEQPERRDLEEAAAAGVRDPDLQAAIARARAAQRLRYGDD